MIFNKQTKLPIYLLLSLLVLGVTFFSLAFVPEASSTSKPTLPKNPQQPDLFNFHITSGAAPGYVEDKLCATCHADIYESYQHVGMSKSFKLPTPENYIENFNADPYFHQPSQRYYQIFTKNKALFFKRYQLDENNQPINLFERKIDYILGSGHKTRSYLYQTELGELYQLPLGWYSQTQQWAMAPGYDNPYHSGVQRPVRRECMFCHNAYPEVPVGSDQHWKPHVFPKQLPQGTGCQRCHGPGAKHIQTVMQGNKSLAEIHNSIVNPARLPTEKRDSVCYQCHLLPSVAMIGVRRFDRTDYSFRPGELASDYLLHVNINQSETNKPERFEINHHAHRLRQSKCFKQSQGELTCISCHNPHRKVPAEQRAQHYRQVCLNCHQTHDLDNSNKPGSVQPATITPVPADDCVACHMPQRRTADVVNVIMTDHQIQSHDRSIDLLAPLKERDPEIKSIEFLIPEQSPTGNHSLIYQSVTQLRALPTTEAVDLLKQKLTESPQKEIQPYLDLAKGLLSLRRFEEAESTLKQLSSKQSYFVDQLMGVALLGQGKLSQAESAFRRVLSKQPRLPEVHFNLGLLLKGQNRYQLAKESFQQAAKLRPNMVSAWYYLGQLAFQSKSQEKALQHYQQALNIEPSYTRAYLGMAQIWVQKGNNQQATKLLKHAQKVAKYPQAITKALMSLEKRN